MSEGLVSVNRIGMLAVVAVVACAPAFSQDDVPEWPGAPAGFLNTMLSGPPQSFQATATAGLPFYTAAYPALRGGQLSLRIVGTDPSLGAATTTVPTVLVPLKFVFAAITGSPTLDGTNVLPAVQNSPIFLTADYTAGAVDLGTTQYGDAVQRAQFWNLPGFSTDYHVLLGAPTITPTVTVNVPAGIGSIFRLRSNPSAILGVVSENFFTSVLNALTPSFTADQLPMFITDNVVLSPQGTLTGCCALGFHASQSGAPSTAKTWVYAAYAEPGFFGGTFVDVGPLSHEVAEWLNDPFVGGFPGINLIPPAVLPNQGGSCIINLEVGDPLEAVPGAFFNKVTNGTAYTLQDEVFLSWYLHNTPSFSVNGWYTLINTIPTFSSLCGPG